MPDAAFGWMWVWSGVKDVRIRVWRLSRNGGAIKSSSTRLLVGDPQFLSAQSILFLYEKPACCVKQKIKTYKQVNQWSKGDGMEKQEQQPFAAEQRPKKNKTETVDIRCNSTHVDQLRSFCEMTNQPQPRPEPTNHRCHNQPIIVNGPKIIYKSDQSSRTVQNHLQIWPIIYNILTEIDQL